MRALQGLHLRFLIHTQDHGPRLLRRIEIEADDIAHFLHKEWISRKFEGFLKMRFQAKRPPNAQNGVLRQTRCLGHPAGAPVSGVFRERLQSAGYDLLDLGVGDLAGLSRTGCIGQARQSVWGKPQSPFAGGVGAHP